MSTILNTARHIMALMQPVTGDRATGVVTVTSTPGNIVSIPRNTFAFPVIDGRVRPELIFKVDEGPEEDGSWSVIETGTAITFISNIGGVRHNIPAGTPIYFDPPIANLVMTLPVADSDFSGATDADYFSGVKDMAIYETFGGPIFQADLRRGSITKFPCIIITWVSGEPADGVTTSQTHRETRAGTGRALYKDTYAITVISSRADSDHSRRHEGLEIIDTISRLIVDRQSVDEEPFSNPSGLQIRSFSRENGPQEFYKKFYMYTIMVSAERNLQQLYPRTYADWLLAIMNVYKPQDPPLPNEGDFTIVADNEIDMS